jgi:integrase
MGLGPCDVIPLADARDLAKAARRLVTHGADPIERRKQKKEEERQAVLREEASKMTFADCVEQFLPGKLAGYRNEKHRWQWKETLERANKAFGDLHVARIDTPIVCKFLDPIWKETPETASRIRGRVEQVLDWAKVRGYREGENPAAWAGHLQHVYAVSEGSNYAAMSYKDVPAFLTRLRERDSASARALEFLILTAARNGEVRHATWSEIDLGAKLWTVPASRMKLHREHVVPLSKQAVAMLKKLPRVGDYIFPGAVTRKPLSDMALMQMLRGLDGNGFKVHGFRSSFRDWSGEETEFENETIEFALAHGIPDSTKAAYRRYRSLNKRSRLMQSWADYLDGQVATGNVLTFAAP